MQIQKLKEKLQELVDENLSLRNETRIKESENAIKISVLESELNNFHKEKNKIINDLKNRTKETDSLQSEIKSLQKEHEALKIELSKEKESTEKHKEKLNEFLSEIDNLKRQISIYEKELLIAVENLKKCKLQKHELDKHMKTMGKTPCSVAEHKTFEALNKQNRVLQQVIRRMRKERLETDPKIENKLTDLENMLGTLKINILSPDCGIDHQ